MPSDDPAEYYDYFNGDKDYVAEAGQVAALIRRHRPEARTLLDVACGTGRHLEYLREQFTCEGLDLDPAMLAVARRRLPGVPLTQADLAGFELGRRFDAVICLFSAIGYLHTVDRLQAAFRTMAAHLQPGGVLVVEPWLLPEQWIEGVSEVTVVEEPDRRAAGRRRTNRRGSPAGRQPAHDMDPNRRGTLPGRKFVQVYVGQRDGVMTTLRIHHVIVDGGELTTIDQHHELRLFTREDYLRAAITAGLEVSWDAVGLTGRGLITGVRPTTAG